MLNMPQLEDYVYAYMIRTEYKFLTVSQLCHAIPAPPGEYKIPVGIMHTIISSLKEQGVIQFESYGYLTAFKAIHPQLPLEV